MTAFKKYLMKKRIKFEEDYDFIPYPVYGGYTSITLTYRYLRDGSCVDVEKEDDNPSLY